GSVHQAQSPPRRTFDVVVACPSFGADHGPLPKALVRWLHRQQQSRALLTSVCAGAFVLAAAGLLTGRRVTTHWALSEKLAHLYPDITVDSDQLIVDEGDLLTAAGTTAWLSLALRIVHRFAGASVVSALAKFYLVDT